MVYWSIHPFTSIKYNVNMHVLVTPDHLFILFNTKVHTYLILSVFIHIINLNIVHIDNLAGRINMLYTF